MGSRHVWRMGGVDFAWSVACVREGLVLGGTGEVAGCMMNLCVVLGKVKGAPLMRSVSRLAGVALSAEA